MKLKSTYKLILTAVILGSFSVTHAQDAIQLGGFGGSKLTNLTPVKKKTGECVSFEASYSEPLKQSPSAQLDIEHHFVNLVNAFLEVTKISDNKYRMALTATTDEGCPAIEQDSRLTISTYSGKEQAAGEMQTLPQSVTFKAEKSGLKKE
ncbi:MAG: hypothetical protein IT286_03510 [Proteobacteria bacterium]|jgi:hypothetical protein|nr:hypothetical protein [Pseudomonadota bacterium]